MAFKGVQAAYKRHPEVTRVRMYLDAAALNLARAKLIVPLADLPLDLWFMQGARPWREPSATAGAPGGVLPSPIAPPSQPQTGENPSPSSPQTTTPEQPSGETWREKMQRLQETPR